MIASDARNERRRELLRSDCFTVELEGRALAGFSACRGLESRRRVFVYREGGATRATCLPDAPEPIVLVLERGLSGDRSLWEWYERGDARDGAISLLGPDGRERARWSLLSAVPSRWRGAELDASRGEVALEELELVCAAIEWPRSESGIGGDSGAGADPGTGKDRAVSGSPGGST